MILKPTITILTLIAVTLAFFTAPLLDSVFLKLTSRFWPPINTTILFKEKMTLFILFFVLHLPALTFFVPKSIRSNGDRNTVALTLNYIAFSVAMLALTHFVILSFPFRPSFYMALFILDVCAAIVVISGLLAWQRTLTAKKAFSLLFYPYHWSSIPVLILGSILILSAFLYKRNASFKDQVNRLRIWNYQKQDVRWNSDQSLFPGITFNHPVKIVELDRVPGYYLVLERTGRLFLVRNGMKSLTLDLSARIQFNPHGENGALGFAFRQSNTQTPETVDVFLFFSTKSSDSFVNHLVKFRINLFQPKNNPIDELPLIKQYHRTNNHHGGDIQFGPDGFLYFSIGDESGMGNDYFGNSQRLDLGLYSGIFRIDPYMIGGDKSAPIRKQPARGLTQYYFIPKDNPFFSSPEAMGEYWALGLRNPFRFSFDSLTRLIWAGDVGQDDYEEIDIVPKGGNHQWSFKEGPEKFSSSGLKGHAPFPLLGIEVEPYYSYRHSAFDRCVIGGFVYRATKHKELYGKYIYADNYSGKVWALSTTEPIEPTLIAVLYEKSTFGISSLSTNRAGDILLTVLGDHNKANGRIANLIPISSASPMSVEPDHVRADIKDKYLMFCARCHGADGKPEKVAGSVSMEPQDLTSSAWQSLRTDEQLKAVIRFGSQTMGRRGQMPGWEDVLSEEEIDAMVKHIRSLGKK